MKQVININFQGRVVPIETTAFEILKNYTDSLNRHFVNEQGKEEIINDIESRIGELFQERIKNGATCIADDDINAIIKSIGKPEDFEPIDEASFSASNTHNTFNNNTGYKRLYRDENNKVVGGVCAGLANYFNIDIVVVRIVFAVLFFMFGFGFLPYIIMWVVVPSTSVNQIGEARKKLFRDADNKMIAGVCTGIANYFNINVWIPRVIFLLPFLSFLSHWGKFAGFWGLGDFVRFTFSPTSLMIYIILWIVIPEAITTSEKLEMKGEKVDLDSIKNSVVEEMKGFGKSAQKFGMEASNIISEKAKIVAGDVKNFNKKNNGGIGNVIALLAKIFAYFIIGIVCLSLILSLFGFGIVSIGLFPLKDYILKGLWQNVFAWGTLLLFITIPLIGVITWIIRKITKSKNNSKVLRLAFGSLWVLGWFSLIMLLVTVGNDFMSSSKLDEQSVFLSNPKINKLIVTSNNPYAKNHLDNNWLNFEPFQNILGEDTVNIKNIFFEINKSPTDSFFVTIKKMASGSNRNEANKLATLIPLNFIQKDSVLLLDKGIVINKTDKFRNQMVLVSVYVPVGKQIVIKSGIGWYNNFEKSPIHIGISNWNRDWQNSNYDSEENLKWQTDVNYIMKSNGLFTLDGIKADGWNDKENRHKNFIEKKYNDDDKIDSLIELEEKNKQRKIDSIETIKNKLDSLQDKIEHASLLTPINNATCFVIVPGVNSTNNFNL